MIGKLTDWIIWTVIAVIAAGAFAAGGALGHWWGRTSAATKIADLRVELEQTKTDWAEERERNTLSAWITWQEAQERSDELVRQLAAAEKNRRTQTEKLQNELRQVTTGQPCFSEPALRLLDQSPGLAAPSLPTSASVTAAADAGDAATHSTDTAIGGWIVGVGAQYAECVSRYHALIDFSERLQSPPPVTSPEAAQ